MDGKHRDCGECAEKISQIAHIFYFMLSPIRMAITKRKRNEKKKCEMKMP